MSENVLLPVEFSDLEPWAREWLLSNERDRLAKLVSTSIQELRGFYDAVFPRMEAMLEWLDRFDVDALPDQERNLFHLLMTFVETAHPIELGWSVTDIDNPVPLERMLWGPPSTTSPLD